MRCEIVTAERVVYSDEVDYVNLPGSEGEMGILPNHSPLLTTLRFGEVYIRKNGQTEHFAIGGGFAEVQPDKVIILADAANRASEIDLNKAQKARDEAERMMKEGVPDDHHYQQIESSLRLAQLHINVGRKHARHNVPNFSEN